jgi:putative Mg2+ transporter-C (MgtC) family protein
LFTMLSLESGGDDPVRTSASIVAGIGSMGVMVIIRSSGCIMGLMNAARIWLSAAPGVGFGGGVHLLTGFAAIS